MTVATPSRGMSCTAISLVYFSYCGIICIEEQSRISTSLPVKRSDRVQFIMLDENKTDQNQADVKPISAMDDFDDLVPNLQGQDDASAGTVPQSGNFVMNDPVENPDPSSSPNRNMVQMIPINKIVANPYQPRKTFDGEKLAELADSIKFQGIIQPLVVVKTSDGYEILVGERRYRASLIAGLQEVPAIIRGEISDRAKLELALIENVQREDLNSIEEARAYARLSEEFNLTQEQIAKKVGKSRPAIANIMRLLNLPAQIQRAVIENKITEGHGRALLPLEHQQETQMEVFEWVLKEPVTVREVENRVREIKKLPLKPYIRTSKAKQPDPEIKQVEDDLREKLGTKVRLHKTGDTGKIMIEFYSQEDLQKIIGRLSRELNGEKQELESGISV